MFQFPDAIKPVFRQPALQKQFESEGYVITELFNSDDIIKLEQIFKEHHSDNITPFFATTYSPNPEHRKKIESSILQVAKNKLDSVFFDYQIVTGCFIVKSPGPESYLHVHQDMTLVDEREFTGINIWSPLVDLNEHNGALYILPGSHRFFPTYRGHTIKGIYDSIQEEIKDYMMPLYLKAGQAVIFDQSIIHFSPPNLSEQIRIVTNIFITHCDARFIICYHDKSDPAWKGKVELFEEDLNFMTDYEQFGSNIYDRPKIGRSLGLVDYDFPELTLDMLENRFGKKRLRDHTPTKKISPPHKDSSVKQNDEVNPENLASTKKDSFWNIYSPSNILKEIKYRLRKNM
ncbi:MAG: phytanoyl-CoA dioxygenase family protein [Chitinophagales bacterium]|nr:phytanoyl-CoA dioxygenase family protein [Chitinophagales bacterium]MDW8273707.1 phytanoyl-CoA dioxygenase family protein [Chitinophagales bacterium]